MGKRRRKIGGNQTFTFNNRKYILLDANKEILEYIAFNHLESYFPIGHWEITIMVLVGSMQSGKSEYTKSICEIGHKIYSETDGGYECYQTNDLEFTLDSLNQNIEKRKKTVFLVFDDAIGDNAYGMKSMATSSSESQDMESILSMVRHKLANEDSKGNPDPRVKNGYCCLMYCVQHPKRLSTFIRKNAAITIYKNVYDELEKEFEDKDYNFLKDITISSDKHIYHARSSALAKTRGKEVLKMFFQRSKFKIPTLIKKRSDFKYDELIDSLLDFDLDEANSQILTAFVEEQAENKDISIRPNLIAKIIRKAKLIRWKNPKIKPEKEVIEKEEVVLNEDLILKELENYNLNKNPDILCAIVEESAEKQGIEIKKTLVGKIIRRAKLIEFRKTKEEKNECKMQLNLEQIVYLIDKKGMNIHNLSELYGKKERQLYKDVESYRNRTKTQIEA